MKIKQFEAPTMSEALRMIKKEFGQEAVILSAKNKKTPARLLGTQRSQQVLVTAAVDYNTPAQPTSNVTKDPSEAVAAQTTSRRATGAGLDASRANRILSRFMPITRTGQQKLGPKFVQRLSTVQDETPARETLDQTLQRCLTAQGVSDAVAIDFSQKAAALAATDNIVDKEVRSALAQVIEAQGLVVPPRSIRADTSRIIILVGPCGVGKTATAAKLAAAAVLHARKKAVIVSLDNLRIAGRAELKRYTRIMGVAFETADDPHELTTALHRSADAHLVVVDTPGLTPEQSTYREHLGRVLAATGPAEVHLLLDAAVQEKVMAKTIDFFKPLGVNRLLFTKLDWAVDVGRPINQMVRFNLPSTYLADSPQIPEGIRPVTAETLAAMLLPVSDAADFRQQDAAAVTLVQRHPGLDEPPDYVANRSSDIFHHKTCKSVQRINPKNMVMFKDPTEAMGQQFKPCRMCCAELFVPKPIDRPVRYHPAGSRY